jgi:hypothetical protein
MCYDSRMRTSLLLLALLSLPLRAELRTFRNAKGEEIRAEIISATATHVELKREDGNKFNVLLTTLSEADRKWIAEWAKTHKHFKVQVAATVKKGLTREAEGDGFAAKTKGNDCWYEISVKNTAAEPLKGVRVEYIAFAPSGGSVRGAADIAAIPAGKFGQAKTDKLFVAQAEQTVRTGVGGSGATITRYAESTLAGLHAEFFLDGKPSGTLVQGKLPADAAAQLKAWREKQPPAPDKTAAPEPKK